MKVTTPDGGRGGSIVRLLVTTAVVLLILLVAGLFAARTDGARSFVADRLSKKLCTDVTIEKMRIGWPYVLVLLNVQSEGFTERMSGFSAREVRMGLGIRTRRTVAVHRPTVNLMLISDGGWQPAVFGALGELPQGQISQISELTRGVRKRTRLSVTDGTLKWLKEGGGVSAIATGVSLHIAPVRLPGHKAHYYSLKAYSVLPAEGAAHMYDLRREWLVTDDSPYVPVFGTGEVVEGPYGAFWRNDVHDIEETENDDQQTT